MGTGSGFDRRAVLAGWARSMIARVPKLTGYDHGFRNPELVPGTPGDRPLVPHGRFTVGTDGEGALSITGTPSWTEGEALAEPRPLVSASGADGDVLLDPGFAYDDVPGNTRRLLLMFSAEGWEDAMAWILGHVDIGSLGKWSSMCNGLPGGRCEPLGLLARLAAHGGPDRACRRYMSVIGRTCAISMEAFPVIDGLCSEAIGPCWERTAPRRMGVTDSRLREFAADPGLIPAMSRAVRLAKARDGEAAADRTWGMLSTLIGGGADDLLELTRHLDDGRAGFVAVSMLRTQTPKGRGPAGGSRMLPRRRGSKARSLLGDVCLSSWNPFGVSPADDALLDSPGPHADLCAWLDATASMHAEGGSMEVERMLGMASAAMDVAMTCTEAVESSLHGGRAPAGIAVGDVPITAIAMSMTGEEPAGARAVAAWAGAARDDATGMRNVVLGLMTRLTHGDDGRRGPVASALRLFRIAAHWIAGGGDVGGLMERAAAVRQNTDGGDDMLALQAWVEGPWRDLPIGFLAESLKAGAPPDGACYTWSEGHQGKDGSHGGQA